jgi:signal transduction histidine kinase
VLDLMLQRRPQRKEIELMISELHGTACTLTSLLDNLLDLSRFENGRLVLYSQVFQVREIVDECLPGWRHVSPGRPFQVSGDFPPVDADRDRVIQILMNLVSNAIKFSTPGTPIEIFGAVDGDWLQLSVRDQGLGISPQEIPKLFNEFYRPSSEHVRRIPGCGLGLSIVRSLVSLHGGKVWAESTPGVGSTFHFTLPLAPVAAGQPN